jgi:hypothetical protein
MSRMRLPKLHAPWRSHSAVTAEPGLQAGTREAPGLHDGTTRAAAPEDLTAGGETLGAVKKPGGRNAPPSSETLSEDQV